MDWKTKVIYVPKADLELIQSIPTEIRRLNLNDFRLALKALESSEEGIPYIDTHRHNTEVEVGGVTLARVVEIINGYTVTFEDGQYAVNLVGANSNVADVVNVNQVSVRSANSAGMTSAPAIEYASFDGAVWIDVNSTTAGTVYPAGTMMSPVNNLVDALLIANYRGFNAIRLLSDLTIINEPGVNLDDFIIMSKNWLEVTVEADVPLSNTEFRKLSVYGIMGGYWNVLVDCWVYDITNFCGWVRGGSIENVALGPYTAENLGHSYFDDLVPMYSGLSSVVTMNTDVHVSFTNCMDIVTIKSLATGSDVLCGLHGGELYIDASCLGGDVKITGVGLFRNNSLLNIDAAGLVNQITIGNAVLDVKLSGHTNEDTVGEALRAARVQAFGRWKIKDNQLLLFADDGLIGVFNLFDESGVPSVTRVFERVPADFEGSGDLFCEFEVNP